MPIIQAQSLRSKANLAAIPHDLPGWYRWWAREVDAAALLDSPYIPRKFSPVLLAHLTRGAGALSGYCYIYTGIAVEGSVRARLDWHINQLHTESAVKSGTLSTLRQSIASLCAGNQRNEAATNNFIDKLVVEYFPVEYSIHSESAKLFLENNEEKEMDEHVLILNIKGNRRAEVKPFLSALTNARKIAKYKEHICTEQC
jgi:hypothetical protein